MDPTFSPDGGQIAFAWEGEKGDNTDIYLKLIGSSEIRRLTSDPAGDVAPSWSPDGRQIAFRRLRSGDLANLSRGPDLPSTIHLVSPVGGSDRRLSDFPARDSQLSWSPDGRWLAAARFASATETDPRASGIYLIPVQGGEPRSITSPSAPTFHSDPALSRDGRHLAYASCFNLLDRASVDVVELGRDYVPTGPPRRLTRRLGFLSGLAWARDGNSVLYGDFDCGEAVASLDLGRPPARKDRARGAGPLPARDRGLLGSPRLRAGSRQHRHLPVRSGTPARGRCWSLRPWSGARTCRRMAAGSPSSPGGRGTERRSGWRTRTARTRRN